MNNKKGKWKSNWHTNSNNRKKGKGMEKHNCNSNKKWSDSRNQDGFGNKQEKGYDTDEKKDNAKIDKEKLEGGCSW